ncbi:MAG: glycogen/starch synthase [Bacteroidaceae bacterium]|nr:glycogen/starch synthase [Bacteroidaceae bacterium]
MVKPDLIFSVSWEVCNKVGGIYTVLSTQAKELQCQSGAVLVFIGPDLNRQETNDLLIENVNLYPDLRKNLQEKYNIRIRVGRWNIPSYPIAILVDFEAVYALKNQIYAQAWDLAKVDSLHAYGDYDEASMFSYAANLVAAEYYDLYIDADEKVVYHAHEWMTGLGALFIKSTHPQIATVFTTHATSIGRSIAGNNKNLYQYFEGYNGDQMAMELNMESKHSVEKCTAHGVDCFTTVSGITARECTQLLDIEPHVVTMNGFEDDFLPSLEQFSNKREAARKRILTVANKLCGTDWDDNTTIIATGGRFEFRNKGIDMFLDAMKDLKNDSACVGNRVIALVNVPAWVDVPRNDLIQRLESNEQYKSPLPAPYFTHTLNNFDQDKIVSKMNWAGLINRPDDNVKVLYVPCYLNGNDGIFNLSYYDLLIGHDIALFPSYYEPWGYTPLESSAFSIPTITTDLAGYGIWVNSVLGRYGELHDGVKVVHRDDTNYQQAVSDIKNTIAGWIRMTPAQKNKIRKAAGTMARKALWKHFIKFYLDAYAFALQKNENNTKLN